MSEDTGRAEWEQRHRAREAGGEPEPFVTEIMPMLPRSGIALDVAAGRGRHSQRLAAHGLKVLAVDYSWEAMMGLGRLARASRLPVWPVVADLASFTLPEQRFDVILNVNYLDRTLFPHLVRALKPGGLLVAETFLIDQATIGHPRNPDFLLKHGELRLLLAGLDIVSYREGLTSGTTPAWRASAVAKRREVS